MQENTKYPQGPGLLVVLFRKVQSSRSRFIGCVISQGSVILLYMGRQKWCRKACFKLGGTIILHSSTVVAYKHGSEI